MRLAAFSLDERLKRLRALILTEVSDAGVALSLLHEYNALLDLTADKIADAWAEGNRIGSDRGWRDGYSKGFTDGQEDR